MQLSPELCPATFSCLKLPDLQCLSFQLRENICALLRIPHPFCNLECASRQKARAVLRLTLFLLHQGLQSYAAWYKLSENSCFIYLLQFSDCLRQEGKSSSCYSLVGRWNLSPFIPSYSQTCLVALLLHGLKSFLCSWGVGKLFLVFRQ